MLVSFNFLKKFIDFKNLSPKDLVEKMDVFGFEIENVTDTNINNLVVGKVINCNKIPDTHLNVCNIFLGDKYGVKQIVCGANNMRNGIKVIVALPGAKLPKAEIQEMTIKGHKSCGMCCSLEELGIDKQFVKDKNCIYEVDKKISIGEENILKKLGFADIIFNVKLPYNRPDLMSILNFAEELSKLFKKKFKNLKIPQIKTIINNDFILKNTSDKCSLIAICIVKNVIVSESSEEIKKILFSFGMQPVNNVVDYANYVMLLTGCPIHIYDYDKFSSKEIIIENNKSNCDFLALNNKKYLLNNNDIVASSNNKIICLSGIIGSLDYSCTTKTKNIVIEVGNFDILAIRRTSLRLNLLTESSKRFIQGIDNSFYYEKAIKILAALIKKDNDNCLVSDVLKIDKNQISRKKKNKISISVQKINSILNTKYKSNVIFATLKRCFSSVQKVKKDLFIVYCDEKRSDIQNINDVAEEILRFLGFESIKNELPKINMSLNNLSQKEDNIKKIKNHLHAFLYEVLTYVLVSEEDSELFDFLLLNEQKYKIINPIINERSCIRKSLIPSLLKIVSDNLIKQNNNFGIFEISNINTHEGEKLFLSVVLTGYNMLRGKMLKIPYSNFYLKGIFNSICDILNIDKNKFFLNKLNITKNELHPGKHAGIFLDGNLIGYFGEIHQDISIKYGIKEKTFVMELNLGNIFSLAENSEIKFKKIPNSRFVERDLCLLVDKNMSSTEVVNIIKKSGGNFIKNVEVFDVYEGKDFKDKKSIAFNIIFLDDAKTLTNDEVNDFMKNIIDSLSKKNIFLRE